MKESGKGSCPIRLPGLPLAGGTPIISKSGLFLVIFVMVRCVALSTSTTIPLASTSNTAAVSVDASPPPSLLSPTAAGKTYYIRPDGGDPIQCTGRVDAPYPGNGSGQPCAWDHPFRALPPDENPRIQGGDTLMVASGSYRMGYGAPGTEGVCDPEGAFVCTMPPVPSGPVPEQPTRILGRGWDEGCTDPPELWGAERADMVLNLTDSSNVAIACLEITDHSECVEFHSGALACERDEPPFGDWAATGLYAEDSADVTLRDLDIHGLASTGVHAGRLTDWTVENVRIAANGWVGWDGDLWEGADTNNGTLSFRRWVVEWNGCGETYPEGDPVGCWAQTAGGYGDGVGTGETGGNWIIEDSAFLHNTSDGLDLLYHTLGGTITLDRVRAEGNAGNQVKVAGQASVTNSVLVGNCGFFEGQAFAFNVDPCRAAGNTIEVIYTGGEQSTIVNSTIYGHGDGLVGAGVREGFACDGSESLIGWNNIFLGDEDFFDPGDITFLFYQESCLGLTFESDYSLAYRVKNTQAPFVDPSFPSANNLFADPLLTGPLSGTAYGMGPTAGSPAIDAGAVVHCPAADFRTFSRPVDGDGDGNPVCDMGAYEWQGLDKWVYLPLAQQ